MNTLDFLNIEAPFVESEPEIVAITTADVAARVILYNDEEHTFDEVIRQIVKATNCSAHRAELLTLEVHFIGKAQVFEGAMTDCLRVSGVLEEIALHTQVEF